MAKRSSKTIAVSMSFDERRFGPFRAINFEVPEFPVIGIYRDGASRTVAHVAESWDDAERWCAEQAA